MTAYLTLAPCEKNEDGTYRDLYWLSSDETAEAQNLWIELSMNKIALLTNYYTHEDGTFFDLEEETAWYCRADDFASDIERIPKEFLFCPEIIRSDLINWKLNVKKYSSLMGFYYYYHTVYKSPEYIPELKYTSYLLEDGEFYEYDECLGIVRFTAGLAQDVDSSAIYLARGNLDRENVEMKFICGYFLENVGFGEISHALEREQRDEEMDILSFTRETPYEYFLPYVERMLLVCENAIKNNHMLIVGTF